MPVFGCLQEGGDRHGNGGRRYLRAGDLDDRDLLDPEIHLGCFRFGFHADDHVHLGDRRLGADDRDHPEEGVSCPLPGVGRVLAFDYDELLRAGCRDPGYPEEL